MATRKLVVEIAGDSRGLDRELSRSQKGMKKWGAAAAKAGAVAAGTLAVGASKAAKAAIEAEKSQARLQAQLKASGISFRDHAKQIDSVIQKHSQLSGLDDEDLQDSFTNIVRVTGNVSKSLRLTGLAADFARAKHMEVAKAGELVGKVAGGNTGILARYGLKVKEGATASEALAMLQRKFAGQAEAYGKTTAGSLDRLRVAGENLGERVGAVMTPALAGAADGIGRLLTRTQQGKGPIAAFGRTVQSAFETARGAVATAVEAIQGWLRRNREELRRVREAFRNVGQAIRTVMVDVIFPVIRRVWPGIRQIIQGTLRIISGVVKTFAALLTGDWRRLWQGIKQTLSGVIKTFGGIVRAATAPMRAAAAAVAKPVKSVLVGAFDTVRGAVDKALTPLRAFIRLLEKAGSIAKTLGGLASDVGKFVSPFGGPKGKLEPNLSKLFAGLGGGGGGIDMFKGLSLSLGLSGGLGQGQGFRPGDPGWHGQNRARDHSGPPAAMMKFAQMLFGAFGSRLKELIYSPMGVGIKNGRPVPIRPFFGESVYRDHFDHVHVAMRKGGQAKQPVRALVGEEGPEIVDLPQGARVHPFSRSKKIIAAMQDRVAHFRSGGIASLNRIFPEHGLGQPGFRMSFNAVRRVFEASGADPRTAYIFATIAKGESSLYPGIRGDDPGGSKGWGLVQNTPMVWSKSSRTYKLMQRLGGTAALRNPFVNAKVALSLLREQGWGAWFGTRYKHDPGAGVASALTKRDRAWLKGGRKGKATKPLSKKPIIRRGVGGQRDLMAKGIRGSGSLFERVPRGTVGEVGTVEGGENLMAAAIAQQAEALAALAATEAERNAINRSVLGVSSAAALRLTADMISGQLGPRVAHLGQSAGNAAVKARY